MDQQERQAWAREERFQDQQDLREARARLREG
jgi:hypothetical protein